MRKAALLLRLTRAFVLCFCVSVSFSAQREPAAVPPFQRIAYTLGMSRPASHLFEVVIDLQVPSGAIPAIVDLQMPLWQPGRYSIADFAENVQEFSARADTQALPFRKLDHQTWQIETRANRAFTVSYKVYGNELSGTFAQLDVTHGNFTGGELFMYVVGHKQDPVDLQIRPPSGWRIINGKSDRPDQTSWHYPNYETLIDNPTEIGAAWTLDEFAVSGKTYRVVIHSRSPDVSAKASLVRDIQKIVSAEVGMWGVPEFDRYTFLIHFAADDRSYDGMEHLASTQIIRGGSMAETSTYEAVLESAAHEFFHAWNVKRLRPIELGPWDWTRPANTGSLWIAEGLTEYYSVIMMRRSGLWDDARTLRDIEGTIGDVENSPGSRMMSAEDSSLAAVFLDQEAFRQQTNFDNTSISYYTKGELIGLILDLTIRERTAGRRSLDDVFRRMYDEFYVQSPSSSYYLKGRGYTQEDFMRVLSQVAGADMSDFYTRYIRGVEPLPYDTAFAGIGLRLNRTPMENSSSGINVDYSDHDNVRVKSIRSGSAAEVAGLQEGDVVVSIGDTTATNYNWNMLFGQYRPGDRIVLQVRRFRGTVDLTIVLGEPQRFSYRLEEMAGAPAAAGVLRNSWLTGK